MQVIFVSLPLQANFLGSKIVLVIIVAVCFKRGCTVGIYIITIIGMKHLPMTSKFICRRFSGGKIDV